jgi:hypothetical protein
MRSEGIFMEQKVLGKLHYTHTSPNIRVVKSRRMRWAWHVACMGEMKNAYKILIRILERKRQCERPCCVS